MADDDGDLKKKTKSLEMAREQISKGWLQTQRERTRLLAAIDKLPIGVLIIDDQNNIFKKNDSVDRILGPNPEGEWTVQNLQAKIESTFDLVAIIKRCLLERRVFGPFDVPYDRQYLRFYVSPVELLRESLALFGVSILVEDITVEKRLEEARDKYIGVASYEIKSPLTLMKAFADNIAAEVLKLTVDDRLKEQTNLLKNETVNLLQAINDYFSLVNFDHGKVPYKKQKINLGVLVKDVLSNLKSKADLKNLSLEFVEVEREVPDVLADPSRVKQVLSSLVDNAIKYTNNGIVTVIVDKKETFLKLSVKDTGLGIVPEKRNFLFRKYVKETGEVSLSLYVSKLVIEDMGGQIYLEASEVGIGSTFSFTLPIAYNT